MKILTVLARLIFVICIPVLAFNISTVWAVNNSQFYTHRFEKYDVQESLAEEGLVLTDSQLQDIASGFIHYFNSSEEFVDLKVIQNGNPVDLFNQEEIIHFKDVKGLFRLDYYVMAGTFSYCFAFALVSLFLKKDKYRLQLAWNTAAGSVLTLALLLILGIAAVMDFGQFFYSFHLIAFTNDYWSAAGNMLLLFPEGFWYDAIIYCAIIIVLIVIILGIVAGAYLFYQRKKDRQNTNTSGAD